MLMAGRHGYSTRSGEGQRAVGCKETGESPRRAQQRASPEVDKNIVPVSLLYSHYLHSLYRTARLRAMIRYLLAYLLNGYLRLVDTITTLIATRETSSSSLSPPRQISLLFSAFPS